MDSFNEFLNENFEEQFNNKIGSKYQSLKKGLIKLLNNQLSGDATKVQNFIDVYIETDSNEVLEGFVEDADIMDFYLKHQSDVDQILADNNYYDDPPDVTSLYDYIIDGTFDAVVYCMEDMKKEIYEE